MLRELVPAWPELNDALFWRWVKTIRKHREKDGNRWSDFHQDMFFAHYWSFGPNRFTRVLDWLKKSELEDDRNVALLLAFHIYEEADRPNELLDKLRAAVNGSAVLMAGLGVLQNLAAKFELELDQHDEELERREESEQWRLEAARTRSEWIDRLKADPGLVSNPPGLKQGHISGDQSRLMMEARDKGAPTARAWGEDWELLIDEFGNDVARAYRKAALRHWRTYDPGLPSEGAKPATLTLNSLHFAIAGLEIEAREYSEFPTHLDKSEIDHALRYITWEIIGFPSWLKTMHQAKPQAVTEAILPEIFWELNSTKPDRQSYQLLDDLACFAPWLHKTLAKPLLTWLRANDPPNTYALRLFLSIIKNGGIDPDEIGALARAKTTTVQGDELLAHWFAVWVDTLPESGLLALKKRLSKLDAERITHFAQLFITALMGNRHNASIGTYFRRFRTAEHLKSLYVLMHTFIRAEDDIHRAGKSVTVRNLREDAQEACGRIFSLLSEIPGKATYVALKELIEEHPAKEYRTRMKELAYRRAEEDGNLEPWTAVQVRQFSSQLTRTPATQRQLFDCAVNVLLELKNRLERGDTSPSATWQKAEDELEIRNLTADWLDLKAENDFRLSQEVEVSNRQRMDICLQNQNIGYPIPIELKLVDNWTGPELCKCLRHQLVGDYLRDGTERYGVLLLIRKGIEPAKKEWKIDGMSVDVSALRDSLKNYWRTVSDGCPNVEDIEVIAIDLSLRALRSNSQIRN